jgi:hypothetical protein
MSMTTKRWTDPKVASSILAGSSSFADISSPDYIITQLIISVPCASWAYLVYLFHCESFMVHVLSGHVFSLPVTFLARSVTIW